MSKTYTHRFTEQGNGFPQDGEEVIETSDFGDATLWVLVESTDIQTHRPGEGNTIDCILRRSDRDYDDLTDEEANAAWSDLHHVVAIEA